MVYESRGERIHRDTTFEMKTQDNYYNLDPWQNETLSMDARTHPNYSGNKTERRTERRSKRNVCRAQPVAPLMTYRLGKNTVKKTCTCFISSIFHIQRIFFLMISDERRRDENQRREHTVETSFCSIYNLVPFAPLVFSSSTLETRNQKRKGKAKLESNAFDPNDVV